ncbi:hypothetical protein LY78DRAFT_332530 [Colletotrichum sublineola]|nr:hypothetical protein LY78DRAFT_332530 [Colletotrichum sublineola]
MRSLRSPHFSPARLNTKFTADLAFRPASQLYPPLHFPTTARRAAAHERIRGILGQRSRHSQPARPATFQIPTYMAGYYVVANEVIPPAPPPSPLVRELPAGWVAYQGEAQSKLCIFHAEPFRSPPGRLRGMTRNGGPCTARSTRFCHLRHVLRTEAERPWVLMHASLLFPSFFHWDGEWDPLDGGNYFCTAGGSVPGRRLKGERGDMFSKGKIRRVSSDDIACKALPLNSKPHNLSRLTTAPRTAYPRECSTIQCRAKRLFSLFLFSFLWVDRGNGAGNSG